MWEMWQILHFPQSTQKASTTTHALWAQNKRVNVNSDPSSIASKSDTKFRPGNPAVILAVEKVRNYWKLKFPCHVLLIINPNQFPAKMWHGFSHDFFTAIWFGSKMRQNAMEVSSFSEQMPWKFHDPNLSKFHVMFQHGKKIKPDEWHTNVM